MGKNIFEGDSFVSVFARCIYPILLKGDWVSYADFMAAYLQLPSKDDLPCNVSKCDQYGELKKAFMLLRKDLTVHFGKDVIEERGNTRSKEYKYVGEETDPLKDMHGCRHQQLKDILGILPGFGRILPDLVDRVLLP